MVNVNNNIGIQGASDIYNQMVEVVMRKRGFVAISKKHLKTINVSWSFIEKSAEILNLQISKRGNMGFEIYKK